MADGGMKHGVTTTSCCYTYCNSAFLNSGRRPIPSMRTSLRSKSLAALIVSALLSLPGLAQSSNQQQSIPDAPSATRPFPKPSVSPTSPPAAPEQQPPANQPLPAPEADDDAN